MSSSIVCFGRSSRSLSLAFSVLRRVIWASRGSGRSCGLLQGLKASLELDARVRVGAGAVERGAVDCSLDGEGLDVALSAGRDLAAKEPVHAARIRFSFSVRWAAEACDAAPQIDLSIGDGREPEAVPRRGVDPVAEPLAADGEGEPSEAYGAVLMVGVQIFGEFGGAMDRLDDDVFRATPLPPRP